MTPADHSYQAGRALLDRYRLAQLLFRPPGSAPVDWWPLSRQLVHTVTSHRIAARAESFLRITGTSLT